MAHAPGQHDGGRPAAPAPAAPHGDPAVPGAAPLASPESPRPSDGALPLVAEELRIPAAILLRELRHLRRVPVPAVSDTARRALQAVEEQARRIALLADLLLELEAIERGEVQLKRRPTAVATLLEHVLETRTAAAARGGISLQRAEATEPATIAADPDRLARALGALLDALLAASVRGASVQVAIERSAQGARVVAESRPPPGSRRRPRRRLGGASLAVARRLAELHGGALDASIQDGAWTARMDLPAAPPATDERRRDAPAAGRARLLVVDDDHDAREALSMMLGDDYDVLVAGDGREALERAAAERPDLVLMDLYMPRMDGLAALEAMRAEPTTEALPVILVSARGDELTRSRSLDLGAVDFLQKPFSARELKARIERTLRLTRRETELRALARTDPLTGLANLRAFRTRLEEEVKRARRYHTPLACVMVDMDNLKPVNDELGHAAGDQAIRAVADVIQQELRETDFGARYGGDEFVLLLPHTSGGEARVFAERVCQRLLDAPIDVGGRPVAVSASFGIAALVDEPLDHPGETLVRQADAALYAAKRAGRGRVAAHPSANAGAAVPLS
jgi:diguanylate cyclase (GGDEF)-like protein